MHTTAILAVPPTEEKEPAGKGPGLDPILIFLLPLLILFVVMPLFNKKEKHRRQRLAKLEKHARVVTSGGIYGTIAAMDEHTVTLEIAKDVRVKVKRSSIFDIEKPGEPAEKEGAPKKAGAKS